MALTLESVVKYIPAFNQEKKRHDAGENEKPLTFHIRVMGAMEFRSFAANLAKASRGLDESAGVTEEIVALYREAVASHVVKIENLVIDGQQVADGAAFYDHPAMPHELVLEIERAVIETNTFTADEEKN